MRIRSRRGSRSLVADSKQSLPLWQIWWADSVAALVLAVLIIREGFETLEEGECEEDGAAGSP